MQLAVFELHSYDGWWGRCSWARAARADAIAEGAVWLFTLHLSRIARNFRRSGILRPFYDLHPKRRSCQGMRLVSGDLAAAVRWLAAHDTVPQIVGEPVMFMYNYFIKYIICKNFTSMRFRAPTRGSFLGRGSGTVTGGYWRTPRCVFFQQHRL